MSWGQAREQRDGRPHPTRDALLESAARLFATSGYTRATPAEIAIGAGVARASFYLYFTSKEDVFVTVARQVRDDILAADVHPGIEDDPVELGVASSSAFLRAYTRHFDLLTVIEHQAISDPEVAAIWSEINERPRRRMVRYIVRLVDEGVAHPAADPPAVAEAVLGMFAQFARRRLADGASFDEAVSALSAMYFRLLGVDEKSAERN